MFIISSGVDMTEQGLPVQRYSHTVQVPVSFWPLLFSLQRDNKGLVLAKDEISDA